MKRLYLIAIILTIGLVSYSAFPLSMAVTYGKNIEEFRDICDERVNGENSATILCKIYPINEIWYNVESLENRVTTLEDNSVPQQPAPIDTPWDNAVSGMSFRFNDATFSCNGQENPIRNNDPSPSFVVYENMDFSSGMSGVVDSSVPNTIMAFNLDSKGDWISLFLTDLSLNDDASEFIVEGYFDYIANSLCTGTPLYPAPVEFSGTCNQSNSTITWKSVGDQDISISGTINNVCLPK